MLLQFLVLLCQLEFFSSSLFAYFQFVMMEEIGNKQVSSVIKLNMFNIKVFDSFVQNSKTNFFLFVFLFTLV